MIDKELYVQIHTLMPIPCVDLVITRANKILLVRRKEEPAKGQLWFPGGRIMRGESFTAAAKRLAKAEAGLDVITLCHVGVGNLTFDEDPFGHGQGTHAVTFVIKCTAMGTTDPILDDNHSTFCWVANPGNDVDPYVRQFAYLAKKK